MTVAQKPTAAAGGEAAEPPAATPEVYWFPTSFAQQRLWFLDQLEPGNPFYNLPGALRLEGDLCVTALRQTLGEVTRRHESLRTTFAVQDGEPMQVVSPPAAGVDLPVADLGPLPADRREGVVAELARRESRRPFDLARGPLLRVALVSLGEGGGNVVLMTLHHIVTDGWSVDVLNREVASIYAAFRRGRPSPLPELPLQYADYSIWQREWLSGDRLRRQVDYWQRTLAGAPPLLELPADRPRPPYQSYRGGRVRSLLSARDRSALMAVAGAERATPFMTYLAIFQALLSRYARQDDVLVGTDVANRGRSELEGLIGFFVNQVVLRTDLSGEPSFRQLVRRVQESTLAAFDHQDLPFDRLVDELKVERDLSRHPLFQVSFVFQNTPRGSGGGIAGMKSRALRVDAGINRFDLTLTLTEGAAGTAVTFDYARDLFDTTTMVAFSDHFRRLCEAAAAEPDRPLGRLPLLSAAERHQVISAWNDTAVDWPVGQPVHRLVEDVARRWPDRVALVEGERSWSYAALEARANRWARALVEEGVGEEVLVPLLIHRGFDLLTAILAVYKAGGAYLPLDPIYPPARLRQVLEGSACELALVGGDLAQEMDAAVAGLEAPPRRLAVSALDAAGDGGADPGPLGDRSRPRSLAYVFYTSGSTGRPKGAMCDQWGLVNHLWAKIDELSLGREDRLAQTASAAFDISVWQYLAPLVLGGSTHVFPDAVVHDGRRLLAWLAEQRITMLEMVPSPLRALLDQSELAGRPRSLPALRWLVATGEALPPALVRRWLSIHPGATVVNAWGATETSDDVTHHAVSRLPRPDARQIPIGRPAGNCWVTVLEPGLVPAPPGMPGELYIGGDMVGRGYHRDPRRTAVAFVPDPLSSQPGTRLYRTGDLGRWSREGVLQFLGRVDHQVKIRGFRVELGEVQAVLGQHPRVEEVMVLDREHPPGVNRLVAYVVGREVEAGELREFVRERLPDYMIPAFFLFLDELPVTSNGKVDRRALAALELPERGGEERPLVAPRNATEEVLARIWEQVLRLPRLSVEDNFFELGGDSILSIQIVAKAAQAGLRLTPRQLFTHQTVAELAAVVETVDEAGAGVAEVALAASGPLPLTPVQRRFFHLAYEDPHHYNQSMLLRVEGALDPALPVMAAHHLALRHDALRQRFHGVADHPGNPGAEVTATGALPVHAVDLSALPAPRRGAAVTLAATATQGSLDLTRGPLARFVHFRFGAAGADRLLLVFHHLAVDGVSWRVILNELQQIHATGQPPALHGNPYRAWAEAAERFAAAPERGAEASFWLRQAGDARRVGRPLPRQQAGANRVATERTTERRFDGEITGTLLRGLPETFGATVEDALLTGLALAHHARGAGPLWLEMEGHGREESITDLDLSGTVGWFTALYPLLLDLERPADPAASLLQVKEAVRRVPDRGVGYGALRWPPPDEVLGAEAEARRDVAQRLSTAPVPEVIFNYHGQVDQGEAGGGAPPQGEGRALFAAAAESPGPNQSRRAARAHLLEVTAGIAGGRLRVAWTWSDRVHDESWVEGLADAFDSALRTLAANCRGGEAVYTPSDFALAEVDQAQLDKALGALLTGKDPS